MHFNQDIIPMHENIGIIKVKFTKMKGNHGILYHVFSTATLFILGVVSFQLTLSEEKQKAFKPRPQGNMGFFNNGLLTMPRPYIEDLR